ncbi:MAG: glycosyltransferase [Desulfobacterales bacterium]|nr:glycosyltransferase [Desulfobacterales bacterium]
MNILQISTQDIAGGAEKIAWMLHNSYKNKGCNSWLAVGTKVSNYKEIIHIPNYIWPKIVSKLFKIAGYEYFNFPASRNILKLLPRQPDIIHCHNLHGHYFDISTLPYLSKKIPVIITLHDAWLLSGYCPHSLDCYRWKIGCGRCQFLKFYPSAEKDPTTYNWKRKKKIYSQSKLYLTAPSQWLINKVKESILLPSALDIRVIPYGIDLSIFRPISKKDARDKLGYSSDIKIVLFIANNIRKNIWKDYKTMYNAVRMVSEKIKDKLLFIALGGEGVSETIGKVKIEFVPYQKDDIKVASYYQASDIYIHAAKADTFPNTILESIACGTPVVATAVGGIPEQIEDGITGFLVPQGDANKMAILIEKLLKEDNLYKQMSINAEKTAKTRFGLERMTNDYLNFYKEINETFNNNNNCCTQ